MAVKRLGIVLAAAMVLIGVVGVGWALVERQLGKHRLAREMAAIENAGGTLVLDELLPPAVTAESNGWEVLWPVTNRLSEVPEVVGGPFSWWEWERPGWLRPLVLTQETVDASTNMQDTIVALHALEEALEAEAELREVIHQAMARSDFDGGFPYEQGFFELPGESSVLLMAGEWLQAEAYMGLMGNDAPAVRRALVSLLRLVHHQRRQPLLIGQLIRYRLVRDALGITIQGLHREGFFSLADLGELREAWARFQLLEGFEQALKLERAIAWQHHQILVTNLVRRAEALEWADVGGEFLDLEEPPAWKRWARAHVQEPLWPWLWVEHDIAWSLAHWNRRISVARLAQLTSWKDAAFAISALDVQSGSLTGIDMDGVKGPRWLDRVRCRFSLGGANLVGDYVFFRNAYRSEVARRMAVVALGVHQFQRVNGRWPERLMEVGGVAMHGAEPIDPMDGRPLRYQALPEGEGFRLYSVGTDGKDDGGSVESEDEDEPYGTLFDGEDWVWPRKAR
jgi:hypothetical protein